MEQLIEIWKPIKNYEGLYEISNYGRVKSLAKSWIAGFNTIRTKPTTVLREMINNHGYKQVILSGNGKRKTIKISLLIWDHFGDKPRNGRKLQVDHIDNIKTHDWIWNLQLLSQVDNLIKYHKAQTYTSKYIGVIFRDDMQKWIAEIQLEKKKYHLGSFDTEILAYKEHKRALIEFNKTGNVTINTPAMKIKSSKHKGIDWSKDRRKWRARIYYDNKSKHIGYFINETDAYNAMEKAIKKLNI